MTETVGFDRLVDLAWLDLLASRYAETRDPKKAFYDVRSVVELTVAGGASHHNATGKTMTVLARIWLRVPDEIVGLRDEAADSISSLAPADRVAVHWTMCELAYPFYLDAATAVGRLLRLQERFSLEQFQQRLTEQWGARGTMPPAARRLLKTWVNWGVLSDVGTSTYGGTTALQVSESGTQFAMRARLAAQRGRAIPIADLEILPDLFPFNLSELRSALRRSPDIAVMGSSVALAVAR